MAKFDTVLPESQEPLTNDINCDFLLRGIREGSHLVPDIYLDIAVDCEN